MSNEAKSRLINIIALLEIIIAVTVMSLGLIMGFLTDSQSNIVAGVGMVLFWALSDIVEPLVCKRFQDATLYQKEAYVKYLFLDAVGYAGILYFLMGIGKSKTNPASNGIMGALVYIISIKGKRDNRDRFYGVLTEVEEEEEPENMIDEETVSDTEEQ